MFAGKNQKKPFDSCLHGVTHSNSHLYQTLNVDPKELGSHLICKGAATYCCAGVHPRPLIITGIPIHCSLLYRLMEVHRIQKKLPDQMMNMEPDDSNMGGGSFNALHII